VENLTDRSETLERERRWRKPAGIAAVLGAIAVQAGLIVNGQALGGDGTAERLLEAADSEADGQLLAGVVIAGFGFLLLAVPLTFFFRAAMARSDRMIRGLLPLGALGAVMIAAGLVLSNSAYLDASDDFAASEAQREMESEQPAGGSGGGGEEQGAETPDQSPGGAAATEGQGGGEGRTTTVQPTTTTTETTAATDESEDEEEDADDRAEDALGDASGAGLSAILYRGGAFVFGLGFLYAGLWAMRTGLLTRFWGSLAMASGVVLGLFFLYFFTLIWFLAMGLFLLGVWPGSRPPAWETGAAESWPRPGDRGDPDGEGDGGTVEGRGRELGGPGEGPPADRDPDTRGGEPPRKRKRRR